MSEPRITVVQCDGKPAIRIEEDFSVKGQFVGTGSELYVLDPKSAIELGKQLTVAGWHATKIGEGEKPNG